MRLSLLADNVSVHEIIFNGYVLENSKHESIRAWCACGELQLAAKIKQDRWKLTEGCLMAERTMEEFVRNVTTKSQSLLTRISQAANAIKMRIPHDRKFLPSKKEISLQQVQRCWRPLWSRSCLSHPLIIVQYRELRSKWMLPTTIMHGIGPTACCEGFLNLRDRNPRIYQNSWGNIFE